MLKRDWERGRGDSNITYFDSTDDEMRRVEGNEDDHQNQHQVEI